MQLLLPVHTNIDSIWADRRIKMGENYAKTGSSSTTSIGLGLLLSLDRSAEKNTSNFWNKIKNAHIFLRFSKFNLFQCIFIFQEIVSSLLIVWSLIYAKFRYSIAFFSLEIDELMKVVLSRIASDKWRFFFVTNESNIDCSIWRLL